MAIRNPNYPVSQGTVYGLADLHKKDVLSPKKDNNGKPLIVGYVKYCFIQLNATLIFLEIDKKKVEFDPWDKMWDTLVREMVHVYLYCFTGQYAEQWSPSEKDNGGHGVHFDRCMSAIIRRGKEVGLFEQSSE